MLSKFSLKRFALKISAYTIFEKTPACRKKLRVQAMTALNPLRTILMKKLAPVRRSLPPTKEGEFSPSPLIFDP